MYSQAISYGESVDQIYKWTINDFDELFYQESGLKTRKYYNCPDTLNKVDCELKRKLYFNKNGQIFSDTSYIDTLYSSTDRQFKDNKITIIKTHPKPSLFRYKYAKTIDSLLIDSLGRPVQYYKNGKYINKWEYDSLGRLVCYCENPDRELFLKKRIYKYLNDTIIETFTRRSIGKFDTTVTYKVFDNQKRLVKEFSYGNSIKYKHDVFTVFYDTIEDKKTFPVSIDRLYEYPNDSTVKSINKRLSMTQIIALDSNNKVINNTFYRNDSIPAGNYEYLRVGSKVTIRKSNAGEVYSTEIRELRPDGSVKCKKVFSMNKKKINKECYSSSGMILQKLSIYDGEIMQNLITIDEK
jgi:hypothetical protein